MTINREQIRRDAQSLIEQAHHLTNLFGGDMLELKLAHYCLALLAELEQAEGHLIEYAQIGLRLSDQLRTWLEESKAE